MNTLDLRFSQRLVAAPLHTGSNRLLLIGQLRCPNSMHGGTRAASFAFQRRGRGLGHGKSLKQERMF